MNKIFKNIKKALDDNGYNVPEAILKAILLTGAAYAVIYQFLAFGAALTSKGVVL